MLNQGGTILKTEGTILKTGGTKLKQVGTMLETEGTNFRSYFAKFREKCEHEAKSQEKKICEYNFRELFLIPNFFAKSSHFCLSCFAKISHFFGKQIEAKFRERSKKIFFSELNSI